MPEPSISADTLYLTSGSVLTEAKRALSLLLCAHSRHSCKPLHGFKNMWLQPVGLYAHKAFGKAILTSEPETLLSNQGTVQQKK